MPPSPQSQPTAAGSALLALVGMGAIAAAAASSFFAGALALGAAGSCIATFVDRRRQRQRRKQRPGEDIGTFARALDRRDPSFDPWVVRATWDALQHEVTMGGREVPIRPSDRLVEDLGCDEEELELEVVPEIAARCGRSLQHVGTNQMVGRVKTVADLIRLVARQPR